MKKIAIIGSGFVGLGAAFKLVNSGYNITVFEKENDPGGLAGGFKLSHWQWSLERHYHHWFSNDHFILNLAKQINYLSVVKRPKSSVFISNLLYQLDSPYHVATFPKLDLANRIRMAAVLAFLRLNPFGVYLDNISAHDFLKAAMGDISYKMIWDPQLGNKFGEYKREVSLSWFWARIYKRTAKLVYPEGGFLSFAEALQEEIEKKGGKFTFGEEALAIRKEKDKLLVETKSGKEKFDVVIVTTPIRFFLKMVENLPAEYSAKLKKLQSLAAVNMVLRLRKPFLKDGTYWLSICKPKSKITAIVEHTNFIDKKFYGGEHLVYLGNYLKETDLRFQMNNQALLSYYDSMLRKINPSYKENLLGFEVFRNLDAQPIISVGYKKIIPPFKTPVSNLYLANMDQVYPWDRGTNYAVEVGEKAADAIMALKH